jgi:hypothetical protein
VCRRSIILPTSRRSASEVRCLSSLTSAALRLAGVAASQMAFAAWSRSSSAAKSRDIGG